MQKHLSIYVNINIIFTYIVRLAGFIMAFTRFHQIYVKQLSNTITLPKKSRDLGAVLIDYSIKKRKWIWIYNAKSTDIFSPEVIVQHIFNNCNILTFYMSVYIYIYIHIYIYKSNFS